MNKVIGGDYKGQGVMNSWTCAVITLPFFKTVKISPATVIRCEVKIGGSWVDINDFSSRKVKQGNYTIAIIFRDGKACALQVNKPIMNTIKRTFSKKENGKTGGLGGRVALFCFLLIIDFCMFRMIPENYTDVPFGGVFILFLALTILCGLYIAVNQYVGQKKWDVVSLNNEMNTSMSIDTYFKKRSELMLILSAMAKYQLLFAKNNGLTDKPSNILKELEQNKELQVHSALIRSTAFYKDLIRKNGTKFSNLFSAEVEHHSAEMSSENLSDARACLSILERYEAVVGKIDETDGMDGHDFEYWCAELLKKNGFIDVEVTKGSGDQGVDVLAVKDGIRYAIQCKCYSSDLGNKPVQEVHAGKAMYRCQVGVVMTNRHFTAGAKELAEATGVLLWDRDKLEEMLEKRPENQ